jgi:hypothetical protein
MRLRFPNNGGINVDVMEEVSQVLGLDHFLLGMEEINVAVNDQNPKNTVLVN